MAAGECSSGYIRELKGMFVAAERLHRRRVKYSKSTDHLIESNGQTTTQAAQHDVVVKKGVKQKIINIAVATRNKV